MFSVRDSSLLKRRCFDGQMTIQNDPLATRDIELQLKGLIYVQALRAAGGATTEELQMFSTEIKRQQTRLERRGASTTRSSVPHA